MMASTLTTAVVLVIFNQLTLGKGIKVTTKYGQIEGGPFPLPGIADKGYQFLNIPFAEPPVGNLRFKPPQPVQAWDEVRDATQNGMSCSQYVVDPSSGVSGMDPSSGEDCLFVNVYTSAVTGKRPVMVFIHGGSFLSGKASDYTGYAYVPLEDVVIVILQYRLGPLGFLTTGDDTVPGNLAILDQIAALTWVQENIDKFGGDPQQVTVFGESAGSISISLLLMSPRTKGLFKRAILQSGSALSWGQLDVPDIKYANKNAKNLAKLVDCSTEDTKAMVDCLREAPVDKLLEPPGGKRPGLYWTPVVDGEVIPADPRKLIAEGRFHKEVDLIIGVCETEGYLLTEDIFPEYFHDGKQTTDALERAVNLTIQDGFPDLSNQIDPLTKALVKEYQRGQSDEDVFRSIVDFVGDSTITIPTVMTANKIKGKTNGKLFFYELSSRPSISTKPDWVIIDHAEDLLYTMGGPVIPGLDLLLGITFTELDKQMATMILKYWANFAKTGDPNGEGLAEWPSYKDNNDYIILKVAPQTSTGYRKDREQFWTKEVAKITEVKNGSSGQPAALGSYLTILISLWTVVHAIIRGSAT